MLADGLRRRVHHWQRLLDGWRGDRRLLVRRSRSALKSPNAKDRNRSRKFVGGVLTIGAVMIAVGSAVTAHAQGTAAPSPATAASAAPVQPTPAQRLMGDIAPKLQGPTLRTNLSANITLWVRVRRQLSNTLALGTDRRPLLVLRQLYLSTTPRTSRALSTLAIHRL